jgi:hypothetical protein
MPDAYRWINSIFSAMEYLLCLMCFIIIPKFLCPTFGVHFTPLGEGETPHPNPPPRGGSKTPLSFRRGAGGEDKRDTLRQQKTGTTNDKNKPPAEAGDIVHCSLFIVHWLLLFV